MALYKSFIIIIARRSFMVSNTQFSLVFNGYYTVESSSGQLPSVNDVVPSLVNFD